MQHTLVAVFDNRGDAQNAMDELLRSGFGRGEVRLSEGDPAGSAGTAGTSTRAADDGSITASIKHFFSDLFGGGQHDKARLYSDAVTRGHYVLTLTAADEPEVERAADIVERHGPIDIDEQAAQWSAAASGLDPARMGAQSQGGAQQQSMQSGTQGSVQGSAAQGSQQRATPAAPDDGSIRKRESPRAGVRVYSHVVETVDSEGNGVREEYVDVQQLRGDEDTYYRNHWNANYASSGDSYDDYAPAYRYGSSMARSDQYRGRQWDNVEGSLRSDWEKSNPGSAWEKFKAAVRHGWERITS